MTSPARGFTLLEVLVALMLMGLLGLMAYRGLDVVLAAEAHARSEMDRWRDVQAALARLESDLVNVVVIEKAPASTALTLSYADGSLALTRLLPEDASGGLRRVAYDFASGRLTRSVWRDAAPAGEAPVRVALLEGLGALQFRCLDGGGAWRGQWPMPDGQAGLPRAIEITLTMASGESLRRVLRLL